MLDDVLSSVQERFPSLPLVYVKSDIEGFEPRMFRGAWRTLAHYQPPEIAFEILGKAFNLTLCSAEAMLRGLFDLGYGVTVKGISEPVLNRSRIAHEARLIVDKKLHFDVFACSKPPCSYN